MRRLVRVFSQGEGRVTVTLEPMSERRFRVQVGERCHEVEARILGDGRLRFSLAGQDFEAMGAPCGRGVQVRLAGRTWTLTEAEAGRRGEEESGGLVRAPMTGTILELLVAEGDEVAAGAAVAVLSAMKMEHKLMAGVSGRVVEVRAAVGETLDQGDLLVRIAP